MGMVDEYALFWFRMSANKVRYHWLLKVLFIAQAAPTSFMNIIRLVFTLPDRKQMLAIFVRVISIVITRPPLVSCVNNNVLSGSIM